MGGGLYPWWSCTVLIRFCSLFGVLLWLDVHRLYSSEISLLSQSILKIDNNGNFLLSLIKEYGLMNMVHPKAESKFHCPISIRLVVHNSDIDTKQSFRKITYFPDQHNRD